MTRTSSSLRAPRTRRALAVVALFALLPMRSARASTAGIPDGDSATLLAILFQAVKDSASMGQLLTSVQSSLETARHTLSVLRYATETVQEFQYLTQNPDEIFAAAEAAFGKTFPEVARIRRETDLLRDALATGPNGELNPYALQDMLDSIGRSQSAFYDTVIALHEGVYGLSEGHLQLLSRQDQINLQGQQVFQEAMDPSCHTHVKEDGTPEVVCGLDQKRASVLSAKASVISSASLSVIGEVLTEQLRLAKLQAIHAIDGGARGSATRLDHARGLAAVAASVDEDLDPRRSERRAPTFVSRPATAFGPGTGGGTSGGLAP